MTIWSPTAKEVVLLPTLNFLRPVPMPALLLESLVSILEGVMGGLYGVSWAISLPL